ncbi:MAG: type II secretion system minor pseudopilin [Syntrophales bacterium]
MTNQRGVALIVVILMLSIIVALTIQLNRDMRSEVYEAANLSGQAQLRYVAESALYAGEAVLLNDKNQYDALTEDWANTEMFSLRAAEYFDNASFKLAIEDLGGRIQINLLVNGNAYNVPVREMLLRLLTGPHFRLETGVAEEIMEAIKDWIDADSEVTGRGAEGAVKNATLDCIEELLMIKGVTRELFYGSERFYGLVNCLAVFGDGKININTAPGPVLRALSEQMTDEAVEALERRRRDDKQSVAVPGWYKEVPEVSALNIPEGSVKIKSDIFQIKAAGVQGRMTKQITAIVSRDEGRSKIAVLSWRVE